MPRGSQGETDKQRREGSEWTPDRGNQEARGGKIKPQGIQGTLDNVTVEIGEVETDEGR